MTRNDTLEVAKMLKWCVKQSKSLRKQFITCSLVLTGQI